MSTVASQITSLTNIYSTVRSKKTSKLRVTGLCVENSPVTGEPVNSPHKGPVSRKGFHLMTSSCTRRVKPYLFGQLAQWMDGPLVIPPLHRRWNGGILDSPRCLSVRLSVRPTVDKVSGIFLNNYWLNSFHTWHLPLWGESFDPYTFSCS